MQGRQRQRCHPQANPTRGLILPLLTEKDKGLGARDTKSTFLAVERQLKPETWEGVTGAEAGPHPWGEAGCC